MLGYFLEMPKTHKFVDSPFHSFTEAREHSVKHITIFWGK